MSRIKSQVKLESLGPRFYRFCAGLTLDDLYTLSGRRLHPPRVSRIERGILRPSATERRLLADILRVSEAKLFGEDK